MRAGYLNEKPKDMDFIDIINCGIGFQLRALWRFGFGQKARNFWPTFFSGHPNGQTPQLNSKILTQGE
jgi:hypothetical protein